MDSKGRVLDKYSARVFKNRKEHVLIKESGDVPQVIAANTRVIPGIMTHRGCCYAGCKGVVLAPIKDVAVITHGPIGCGFYSWGTRRNKARPGEDGKNFVEYCLSTDMQEADIVFGGEKKLRQAIKETVEIFDPGMIMVCSTCPVGLIGDDIHAIAAEAEELYKRPVMAFSCEGYKGVSQSGGHHIANNGLMKRVLGTGSGTRIKHAINILGEYNIGGDGWEIGRILKKCGYHVVSVMTGDGSFKEMQEAHTAELNIVQCHRSINYIAEMLKTKFGTDWIKVNFIGVDSTAQSLRDMALYFGDQDLIDRTEEVIAEEMEEVAADMEYYRTRLKGKTAALYVGGSRAHHYQRLLQNFGIDTIMAGYEFAHRDDYEGSEGKADIKEDADSKNIETITVNPDPEKYHLRLTPEQFEELKARIPLDTYQGMIRDMKDGAVIVDDLNHFETEEFLKLLKPDIFFSGIKDKYVAQKGGTLSRQLHSYDYSGPYAGFKGAVNFGKDVTMGIYTPAWGFVTPPWKHTPTLVGTYGGDI